MAQSQPQFQEPFTRLKSYNFQDDPEFANGLAIILGHPETPASQTEINREDDLVLQAKCFFFSRKENISPPINFTSYKSWLESSSPSSAATQESHSTQPDSTSTSGPGPIPPNTAEPAYPSSFAHIVELITTGQPVPGIQEIPDTVLEGHDISSEKPRRRKPWEKDDGAVVDQGQAQTEGGASAGEATTSAV